MTTTNDTEIGSPKEIVPIFNLMTASSLLVYCSTNIFCPITIIFSESFCNFLQITISLINSPIIIPIARSQSLFSDNLRLNQSHLSPLSYFLYVSSSSSIYLHHCSNYLSVCTRTFLFPSLLSKSERKWF